MEAQMENKNWKNILLEYLFFSVYVILLCIVLPGVYLFIWEGIFLS
jgi:hypothetical protein